jgi:hypothetical protein
MLKLNYDEIIEKIITEKGVSKEEIEKKINEKIANLSDLISKEGAAHIIANQYGIKLFENFAPKDYKISEIAKGVNGINVVGKILTDFEVREFNTPKRQGKLGFCSIGDDSGVIRLVIWDEKIIDNLKENAKKDSVLKVNDAYSRDNNGYLEIHLGSRGKAVLNPEGIEIGEVKQVFAEIGYSKKNILELKADDRAEIYGTIVQVYEPRFYDACEKCGKKVLGQEGTYSCNEHGEVVAKKSPVFNFFFDDASANIRVVCFAQLAEEVLGKSGNDLAALKPEEVELFTKKLLGKQMIIKGRVNKNINFDRLEFVANSVKEADPAEVIESLK